jgi:hypothetical protein
VLAEELIANFLEQSQESLYLQLLQALYAGQV